ncbi:MAG: UvrD-helicase domain-containing protein, partial [Pirellulaceae bacterium]
MNPLLINSMILASAGTGKTFQLSNRYISLLIDGVPARSILATTFTRKAAGEILDRIVLRLAEAARDPKVATRTALELNRPDTTADRFAELLTDLVHHLNT